MTSPDFAFEAPDVKVHFAVRWFGFVTVRGTVSRVLGRLALPSPDLSQAALTLTADARSVDTGLGLRDHHLRAERFLHADLHPSIRFTSTALARVPGQLVVEGSLSLRGVSSPVRAECLLDDVQGDGEYVRVRARFVVSRSRHGVGLASGIRRYHPLLRAIADQVLVTVTLRIPEPLAARIGLTRQGARPRAATGHDDST